MKIGNELKNLENEQQSPFESKSNAFVQKKAFQNANTSQHRNHNHVKCVFFSSSFLLQIFGDHYHFHHKELRKRSVNPSHHHQNRLNNDDRVHWSQQQRIKSRRKRDFLSFHTPDYPLFPMGKNRIDTTDPKWPQMWYLVSDIDLSIQSICKLL